MKEVPHTTLLKCGSYPMDYVYIDVVGFIPVTRFDGSQYWVIFLHDYTRNSEVILIAIKNNVPKEF